MTVQEANRAERIFEVHGDLALLAGRIRSVATPKLEKIVIDASGEILALGDHPVVLREALEGVPHVMLDSPGVVRIVGTTAGQLVEAVYTIRGQSLDGLAWHLTRRY